MTEHEQSPVWTAEERDAGISARMGKMRGVMLSGIIYVHEEDVYSSLVDMAAEHDAMQAKLDAAEQQVKELEGEVPTEDEREALKQLLWRIHKWGHMVHWLCAEDGQHFMDIVDGWWERIQRRKESEADNE